ncbi:YbaK/EbsC family protein [Lipingzhangella sp. LS1_29]|uniref:YbaK/EbsC family protein n=1 Tax=Lipingzhangella rawalii TaxID=2055835 RepID=A0ABU2H3A7_9ACTN|nr:YbaK/EbsC family protein [Lipingzhangella rawalii]MDS1269477.1 YbaK/EbsC family protein [Lipingzhangella rawalii]
MHPNAQKVAARLSELGVSGDVTTLAQPAPTAAAAAALVGCPVGAIANSLVFAVEYPAGSNETGGGCATTAVLVLTSGAHRVDTGRLAELLADSGPAQPVVGRATPEFVRTHTGQPIGGVAPVGHPRALPTVVDTWLADHETVWAAGGHPHTVFPTTFSELIRITGGTAANVGTD